MYVLICYACVYTCKILLSVDRVGCYLNVVYVWFLLAGSLGALIHADRLRERLPSSVKTLHLLVDGGLFVDVVDINNDRTMGNVLRDVFYFHHAHSRELSFLCLFKKKRNFRDSVTWHATNVSVVIVKSGSHFEEKHTYFSFTFQTLLWLEV